MADAPRRGSSRKGPRSRCRGCAGRGRSRTGESRADHLSPLLGYRAVTGALNCGSHGWGPLTWGPLSHSCSATAEAALGGRRLTASWRLPSLHLCSATRLPLLQASIELPLLRAGHSTCAGSCQMCEPCCRVPWQQMRTIQRWWTAKMRGSTRWRRRQPATMTPWTSLPSRQVV